MSKLITQNINQNASPSDSNHYSLLIAYCSTLFSLLHCSLLIALDFSVRPRGFAFFPSEVPSDAGYSVFKIGDGYIFPNQRNTSKEYTKSKNSLGITGG